MTMKGLGRATAGLSQWACIAAFGSAQFLMTQLATAESGITLTIGRLSFEKGKNDFNTPNVKGQWKQEFSVKNESASIVETVIVGCSFLREGKSLGWGSAFLTGLAPGETRNTNVTQPGDDTPVQTDCSAK
jgi:hypothetical protein